MKYSVRIQCWIINIVAYVLQKCTQAVSCSSAHLWLETETRRRQKAGNAARYLLDLGLQWVSHVVAVVALSRAQSDEKGRKGRTGRRVRSAAGEQLGVEVMERCWWWWWWWGDGGVMAPQPLCHMAPSQVQGEACRPPTGKQNKRDEEIRNGWLHFLYHVVKIMRCW